MAKTRISFLLLLVLTGCNQSLRKLPLSELSVTSDQFCQINYKENVQPIMSRYCLSCHSGATSQGNLNLESFTGLSSKRADKDTWSLVASRMENRSMPPPGNAVPSDGEIVVLKQWVSRGFSETKEQAIASCGKDACSGKRKIVASPMTRLTRSEYVSSLTSLFGSAVLNSPTVVLAIATVPMDTSPSQFDTMDTAVTASQMSAYYDVARAISDLIADDSTRWSAFMTPFGVSGDASAAQGLIDRFGLKLFRRPVKPQEASDLMSLYQSQLTIGSKEGVRVLLFAMLQWPDFLFHLETAGQVTDGDNALLSLSAHELASRLSFFLVGSTPDDLLLSKANDGSLIRADVWSGEVSRLLSSPLARTKARYFYEQWLSLDLVPDLDTSPDYLMGLNASNFRLASKEEALRFAEFITFDSQGGYQELLTSRDAFVPDGGLASIYGVSAAAGKQSLTDPGRAGILTRAAFLASATRETSPIHRGKLIRTKVLCDEISLPDPSQLPAGALNLALDPTKSTRQRVELKTGSPECLTCHSQMNPLGYALEAFDSAGRYRTVERLFNSSGNYLSSVPIDSSVVPVIQSPSESPVSGPSEFSSRLASDEKAQMCFARQWFRYGFRRKETSDDICAIQSTYTAMTKPGGGILAMMQQIANLEEFKYRRIPE